MSVSSYAAPMRGLMGMFITIAPFAGLTGNNTRSYGTLRTYQCYMAPDNRLVVNAQGQQVPTSARTHIYPIALDGTILTALSVDDRLTLPDGKQPRLLTTETQYDQFGRIILHVAVS
jgi:hypothetical protein